MENRDKQRKLAAIMFTDLVGFSALAHDNEALALALLDEHRELLRTLIPQFHGSEIKTLGDGFLLEFDSALEAVRCAVAIQTRLKKRNDKCPDNRQIHLRIGIHVGDVIHDGSDVYGDGVNITSRIEPLAEPGGICISDQVHAQVHNKEELPMQSLGRPKLKNIQKEIEVYRVVLPWQQETLPTIGPATRLSWYKRIPMWVYLIILAGISMIFLIVKPWALLRHETQPAAVQKAPTPNVHNTRIAILPFENLGDSDDEYFADGMTEEITARLANVKELGVIGRKSILQYKNSAKPISQIGQELAVQYVLEGTVRWQKSADGSSRIRVTPQLIRVSDETHLWAEIYDEQLDDIFRLQTDIALQIVGALKINLLAGEESTLKVRPTENLKAYNYYLRGVYHDRRGTLEDTVIAKKMFSEAIRLDPKFALAHAKLAQAFIMLHHDTGERKHDYFIEAKLHLDRSFALDPDLVEAHIAQGLFHLYDQGDLQGALRAFRIALAAQPNNIDALWGVSAIHRMQLKEDQALSSLLRAISIDPLDPYLYHDLGNAYNRLRIYEEAEKAFDKAMSLLPDAPRIHLAKAWLYLLWQGDTIKARSVIEKALRMGVQDDTLSMFLVLFDMFERNYHKALNGLSTITADARIYLTMYLPTSLVRARLYGYLKDTHSEQTCYETARQFMEKKLQQEPDNARFHSALGFVYAGMGKKTEAIHEGKRAVAIYEQKGTPLRVLDRRLILAQIYALVGEHDLAMDEIEHQLSTTGLLSVPLLRIDPVWDSLRSHARFQKILEAYSSDT